MEEIFKVEELFSSLKKKMRSTSYFKNRNSNCCFKAMFLQFINNYILYNLIKAYFYHFFKNCSFLQKLNLFLNDILNHLEKTNVNNKQSVSFCPRYCSIFLSSSPQYKTSNYFLKIQNRLPF